MTVDRFPSRRGKLPCGHPLACMFRYRTSDGKIKKYCLACVCEKSGVVDIDTQIANQLNKSKEQEKEPVTYSNKTDKTNIDTKSVIKTKIEKSKKEIEK